jgi:hypothetical protein
MNKILTITAILMTAIMTASVLADTATGTANVYCTQPSDCTQTILTLENKNSTTWAIIGGDGISATLTFGTIGPTFKGTLTTSGLGGSIGYALIYYPDNVNRFVSWNGAGGVVIATWNGNVVNLAINNNLGINLPIPADWNVNPVPNYCNNNNGFDSYAHCAGAKIWIVPTSDLTGGPVLPLVNWNPVAWLFETDLVTYTIGNPTTTCVGGQCVPIVCGMTATGSPAFGNMVQGTTVQSGITTTVTNTGNVQVNPLISGVNWVGSTYSGNSNAWMPVGATQWTDTIWANVVPLTTTPTSMGAIGIAGTATVSYQLTVPSPQPTDTYSQTITFTASC